MNLNLSTLVSPYAANENVWQCCAFLWKDEFKGHVRCRASSYIWCTNGTKLYGFCIQHGLQPMTMPNYTLITEEEAAIFQIMNE